MHAISIVCALASIGSADVTIAVLPLRGSATDSDRALGSQILVDALRGIEGLQILPIGSLKDFPGAQQALDACAPDDDACAIKATSILRYDGLVAGTLDVEDQRMTLRVHLTSTSSKGLTNGIILRDISDPGALRTAIAGVASELFAEQSKRSFGTLVLKGGVDGAAIAIDGELKDTMQHEKAQIRLRPGRHEISARAPGRRGFEGSAEILVGQKTELELDLPKNRSKTPYVLGGIGVVAAGAGLLLGLAAKGIQHDWESGCPMGQHCLQGFTEERYASDTTSINRDKVSADGLFVVSAIAIIAGIVWYILDPGSDTP